MPMAVGNHPEVSAPRLLSGTATAEPMLSSTSSREQRHECRGDRPTQRHVDDCRRLPDGRPRKPADQHHDGEDAADRHDGGEDPVREGVEPPEEVGREGDERVAEEPFDEQDDDERDGGHRQAQEVRR